MRTRGRGWSEQAVIDGIRELHEAGADLRTGTIEKADEPLSGAVQRYTGREINAYWKSQGRPWSADVTLGKLVRDKQLKRTPLEGERGSRYLLG